MRDHRCHLQPQWTLADLPTRLLRSSEDVSGEGTSLGGRLLAMEWSLPGCRSRHKPVCPIPSAKVNPQSKVVCTVPPPRVSYDAVSITGVWHSRLSPRGSDVGKRVSSPYNGKEGPRSPHPPRGPLSTSACRCAAPLDVAVASSPATSGNRTRWENPGSIYARSWLEGMKLKRGRAPGRSERPLPVSLLRACGR